MVVHLKDLTSKITKGTTPSNIGESFSDFGVMYFRSELLGKSKYIDKSHGLLYITESVHQKLKRSQIQKGDLLFSMAGAYLGKISLVGEGDYPANTNQAVAIIRLLSGKCNIDYLYYYMTQRSFNEYVCSFCAQAAQPNINLEQIGKLKVNLPPLATQQKIASILSAYDLQIENNQKRIMLLEKVAENLYKEWFVRFRFPGHEIAEFEGGMPKGWSVVKLDQCMEVCYGKDHKKIEDGEIPVFGSGGIMRYGNRSLFEGESVLIPRKGSLNNVMYFNGKAWTVDTMFYTKMHHPYLAKYLFYTLRGIDLASFNSGAALPSMTTDILYHFKVIKPDEKVLKKFDEILCPLYDEKELLVKQNKLLAHHRDLLLPRLMSGRISLENSSNA